MAATPSHEPRFGGGIKEVWAEEKSKGNGDSPGQTGWSIWGAHGRCGYLGENRQDGRRLEPAGKRAGQGRRVEAGLGETHFGLQWVWQQNIKCPG